MTNSQEMQKPSTLYFSEEIPSSSLKILLESKLLIKDKSNDKGNSSTKPAVKNIKEILPWLADFNFQCRSAVGSKNIRLFDESLLMLYLRNICENVKDCYLKPNRAARLKESMYETLIFFHLFYKDIKDPLENSYYLDKMSVLVSMYIDMELKASRRKKESERKLSKKLTTALYMLLDNSIEHILDAILKSKFFTKNFREIAVPILGSVLNKVRSDPMHNLLYIRYILAFKLWKKIIDDNEFRKKINRIALQQLQPPKNFIDKSKLYSKVLPWIPKSKKNITLFLMQAKFNLKSACQAFLKMVNDTQQSGFSSICLSKTLYHKSRISRDSVCDKVEKQGICSLIDSISESIASAESNTKPSLDIDQKTIQVVSNKRKDKNFEKPLKKKIKSEDEHQTYNQSDFKSETSKDWIIESNMLKKLVPLKALLSTNNYKKNNLDDENFLKNESNILNIEVKKEQTIINDKNTLTNKLSPNDISKQMNKLIREISTLNSLLTSNLNQTYRDSGVWSDCEDNADILSSPEIETEKPTEFNIKKLTNINKNEISKQINKLIQEILILKSLHSSNFEPKNKLTVKTDLINPGSKYTSNGKSKDELSRRIKKQSILFNKERKDRNSSGKLKKSKESEQIKIKEKFKKKKCQKKQESSNDNSNNSDIIEIKIIKPQPELINLEESIKNNINNNSKIIKSEMEKKSFDTSKESVPRLEIKIEKSPQIEKVINTLSSTPQFSVKDNSEIANTEKTPIANSISEKEDILQEEKNVVNKCASSDLNNFEPLFKQSNSPKIKNEIEINNKDLNANVVNQTETILIKKDVDITNLSLINKEIISTTSEKNLNCNDFYINSEKIISSDTSTQSIDNTETNQTSIISQTTSKTSKDETEPIQSSVGSSYEYIESDESISFEKINDSIHENILPTILAQQDISQQEMSYKDIIPSLDKENNNNLQTSSNNHINDLKISPANVQRSEIIQCENPTNADNIKSPKDDTDYQYPINLQLESRSNEDNSKIPEETTRNSENERLLQMIEVSLLSCNSQEENTSSLLVDNSETNQASIISQTTSKTNKDETEPIQTSIDSSSEYMESDESISFEKINDSIHENILPTILAQQDISQQEMSYKDIIPSLDKENNNDNITNNTIQITSNINIDDVKISSEYDTKFEMLKNEISSENTKSPIVDHIYQSPINLQVQSGSNENNYKLPVGLTKSSENERLLQMIELSLLSCNSQEEKDSSLPLKKRLKTISVEQDDLQNISQLSNENQISYSSTPMLSITDFPYLREKNEYYSNSNNSLNQTEDLSYQDKSTKIVSSLDSIPPSKRQFRTPAERKEMPSSSQRFNNIKLLIQPDSNKIDNQISFELSKVFNKSLGENSANLQPLDLSNKGKKHRRKSRSKNHSVEDILKVKSKIHDKRKHSHKGKSHSEKFYNPGIIKNNSKIYVDFKLESTVINENLTTLPNLPTSSNEFDERQFRTSIQRKNIIHHVKCCCRDCTLRTILFNIGSSEQIPCPIALSFQRNLSECAARKFEDEKLLKSIEESLFGCTSQDSSLPLKKRFKNKLHEHNEYREKTRNLLYYPSTPMLSIADLLK